MDERIETRVIEHIEEEPGHSGQITYTVTYAGSLKEYMGRVRRGISNSGAQRLTIYFPTEDRQSVEPTSFDVGYRHGYPPNSRRLPTLTPSGYMQPNTYLLRLLGN